MHGAAHGAVHGDLSRTAAAAFGDIASKLATSSFILPAKFFPRPPMLSSNLRSFWLATCCNAAQTEWKNASQHKQSQVDRMAAPHENCTQPKARDVQLPTSNAALRITLADFAIPDVVYESVSPRRAVTNTRAHSHITSALTCTCTCTLSLSLSFLLSLSLFLSLYSCILQYIHILSNSISHANTRAFSFSAEASSSKYPCMRMTPLELHLELFDMLTHELHSARQCLSVLPA